MVNLPFHFILFPHTPHNRLSFFPHTPPSILLPFPTPHHRFFFPPPTPQLTAQIEPDRRSDAGSIFLIQGFLESVEDWGPVISRWFRRRIVGVMPEWVMSRWFRMRIAEVRRIIVEGGRRSQSTSTVVCCMNVCRMLHECLSCAEDIWNVCCVFLEIWMNFWIMLRVCLSCAIIMYDVCWKDAYCVLRL